MSRNRGPPRDLFGFDDPQAPAGKGMVALELVLHRTGNAAWLLSEPLAGAKSEWIAFSVAKRGEGRDENIWTLPKWKARELGWI